MTLQKSLEEKRKKKNSALRSDSQIVKEVLCQAKVVLTNILCGYLTKGIIPGE